MDANIRATCHFSCPATTASKPTSNSSGAVFSSDLVIASVDSTAVANPSMTRSPYSCMSNTSRASCSATEGSTFSFHVATRAARSDCSNVAAAASKKLLMCAWQSSS